MSRPSLLYLAKFASNWSQPQHFPHQLPRLILFNRGACLQSRAFVAQPEPADTTYEPAREPLSHTSSKAPFTLLPFDDYQAAYATKSTSQLLTALAVFRLCQVKPLVQNADKLLAASRRVASPWLTNYLVKNTFFAHFCAGETQESIRPVLRVLHKAGVGAILDYAAEDDVSSDAGAASRSGQHSSVIARTYPYEGEAACDRHMHVFLDAIQAAADSPGRGFAAIKVTALGVPRLLERVSNCLLAIRDLFRRFDLDSSGIISYDEFRKVYSELFSDATPERVAQLLHHLDPAGSGGISFLSWSQHVRLQDVPAIVQRFRMPGPLHGAALTPEELGLLDNMMERLHRLARVAEQSDVRLMVDAEQSYFQPAIDHAVLGLQREHNRTTPTIFNTYQCYLRDSGDRLRMDLERARLEGWAFAAKLVRGAYIHVERQRACEMGCQSPVFDTIQETHANYDRCVETLLEAVAGPAKSEVMIATHNQASITAAVERMHQLDLSASHSPVYFGQLLGMADHLTFNLGHHGYSAYKYVPFGKVEEVMPYLIRRAQENSDIMSGLAAELAMVRAELRRRLRHAVPLTRWLDNVYHS